MTKKSAPSLAKFKMAKILAAGVRFKLVPENGEPAVALILEDKNQQIMAWTTVKILDLTNTLASMIKEVNAVAAGQVHEEQVPDNTSGDSTSPEIESEKPVVNV